LGAAFDDEDFDDGIFDDDDVGDDGRDREEEGDGGGGRRFIETTPRRERKHEPGKPRRAA
jgi:hypothetical protein